MARGRDSYSAERSTGGGAIMKVGDLVRLTQPGSVRGRAAGIVIKIKHDLRGTNGAAKICWADGRIEPWLFEDLEVLSESR